MQGRTGERSAESFGTAATNDVLETGSPEITVFDAARVRLQRYVTRGGDGMVIARIEDSGGGAVVSLSLFGAAPAGGCRETPSIEISSHDELGTGGRARAHPLPGLGDGRVRYLIVGDSEEAVRREADTFRRGWDLAYNPMTGPPHRRGDGRWVAEATRWHSCD